VNLLGRESVLIAAAGTIAGIVLTFAARGIVTVAFSPYLALSFSIWPLPGALLGLFCALMLGGMLGARTAVRQGLEEALSYQK